MIEKSIVSHSALEFQYRQRKLSDDGYYVIPGTVKASVSDGSFIIMAFFRREIPGVWQALVSVCPHAERDSGCSNDNNATIECVPWACPLVVT